MWREMPDAGFSGACHCRAIGFRYSTSINPEDWSIRACQCQFCRAHDALSTSDPDGKLQFVANEPSRLHRYRFSLQTADFMLCSNCGVYIGAVIESDGHRFGIINVRALSADPDGGRPVAPISYDGEDRAGRIRRRKERWTPVTAVPW